MVTQVPLFFLRCATNNRTNTVLCVFREAVDQFGIPQRVRTDQGDENADIWRYLYDPPKIKSPDKTLPYQILFLVFFKQYTVLTTGLTT